MRAPARASCVNGLAVTCSVCPSPIAHEHVANARAPAKERGREGGREGGKERRRERGRKGGREGGRKGGRKGGREGIKVRTGTTIDLLLLH